MASESEAASAVAIPAASNDANDCNNAHIDATGNGNIDAYSGNEQKHMSENGQILNKTADLNISYNADNDDHDAEYESSLSSPTSSLSSANEAMLETTPPPQDSTQDSPSSLPASTTAPDEASMALDYASAADANATLSSNSNASVVPLASSEPSAATEADAGTGVPAASGSEAVDTAMPLAADASSFAAAIAAISAVARSPSVSQSQPQTQVDADAARDASESLAKAKAEIQAEVESNEPGIDIDKMLDAISADAPLPAASSSAAFRPSPSNPQSGQAMASGGFPSAAALPTDKVQPFPYAAVGAPGTVGGMAVLGAPPSSVAGIGGAGSQVPDAATASVQTQLPAPPRRGNNAKGGKTAVDKAYEEFLLEERRYMADPNWEKFPDGSRMFIGNLSQERVSKRDVFEAFHRFGRLAQISIKSAYGFVQYHKASEAQDAMKNLQGFEIRGRKINLELSRPQKKEKERERSPERSKGRGGRGGDRYDGRDHGREHGRRRGRDDYRPDAKDREASPRRDRGGDRDRDEHHGRERGGRDGQGRQGRDRSRSPNRPGAGSNSRSYRSRRSPSPYGRSRGEHGGSGSNFDGLKGRHASDVPDVQFLVTQGLERDFIKWVQGAFTERGLKTDIMLMTPHSPSRDAVIQTHVLEGVIAVVDLNINSQSSFKIPLQVFDRSAGTRNVRFDGYQDLTPQIAADVVARSKAASAAAAAAAAAAANQHIPYQAPGGYGQQYMGATPGAPAYPTSYQTPSAAVSQPAVSTGQPAAYDLASLMGQLDGQTLSQLLATLQPSQAAAAPPAALATPAYAQGAQYGQSAGSQVNLGALLSTLGASNGGSMASMTAGSYGGSAPYAGGVAGGAPSSYMSGPQGGSDQSIQAIMAQLAQYKK